MAIVVVTMKMAVTCSDEKNENSYGNCDDENSSDDGSG